MIRNVIFDWSGTLVDDLPAVWEASNHCFALAGVPSLSLAEFRAEFRLPYRGFYDKFVPHVPLEELEGWFRAKFLETQESVVALPHAREFLEYCRACNLRTFLLSTVHPLAYAHQAQATALGEFIQRPYCGIADKRAKIAELLSDHALLPEETVFIGDMEHDIETARHGGIRSVAVLTGYNSLAQLRAAQPDLVVEHLGELRTVLERHDGRLPAVNGHARPAAAQRPIATVGGLIFNDAGRVLMLRTHKWSDLWGIPGGKIEWNETSGAALVREVKEETNLDVTDVRFVLVQDAIQPPEFYREAHFILINYTCRAAGQQIVRLNAEAEEFRWVTMTEAFALPLNAPTKALLKEVRRLETRGSSPMDQAVFSVS
jgi:phosphoglycolate phosphatase